MHSDFAQIERFFLESDIMWYNFPSYTIPDSFTFHLLENNNFKAIIYFQNNSLEEQVHAISVYLEFISGNSDWLHLLKRQHY